MCSKVATRYANLLDSRGSYRFTYYLKSVVGWPTGNKGTIRTRRAHRPPAQKDASRRLRAFGATSDAGLNLLSRDVAEPLMVMSTCSSACKRMTASCPSATVARRPFASADLPDS